MSGACAVFVGDGSLLIQCAEAYASAGHRLLAPGADPELAAIEAGAQDFEPGDEAGHTLFVTDPTDLDLVSRALPAQGFTVLSATLSAADLEEVEAFLAAIDGNDDVQNVYVGLAG